MTVAKKIELLQLAMQADPSMGQPRHLRLPSFDAFMKRRDLSAAYAWAIPTEEALARIVEWSPIVEIGAGTGYWAMLLRERGADVVVFDPEPAKNRWCDRDECFTSVEIGGIDAIDAHHDRALFLCWPPYGHPMAAEALDRYHGERVIYVGEWVDGCCADAAFFEALERDWTEAAQIDLPQWDWLHDALWCYTRKRRLNRSRIKT